MKKLFIIFLVFASCVNPYDFRQDIEEQMLVVEGYVSDEPGNSKIKLSLSADFDAYKFDMVEGAVVTVIENEAVEHPFYEQSPGVYSPVQSDYTAISGNTYKLSVQTGGRSYESDLVSIKPSLEIDSLHFVSSSLYESGSLDEVKTLEVQLTSFTDESSSRYYRYTTTETWLTEALYSENRLYKAHYYEMDGTLDYKEINPDYSGEPIIFGPPLPVDVEWEVDSFENIRHCWKSGYSEGIRTYSTEGLTRNQLIFVPVFNVPVESDRLLYKYSALVRQYSINNKAYFFLNMMKEFSENQGSLYDVQPGFVDGNMHSLTDEKEKVIGIFYASAVQSHRIFIRRQELTPEEQNIVYRYYPNCETETVNIPITDSLPDIRKTWSILWMRDTIMREKNLKVYDVVYEGTPGADVVQFSKRFCIDCRVSGSNVKPEWWGEIY